MYTIKNITNGTLRIKTLNKVLRVGETVDITSADLPKELTNLASYRLIRIEKKNETKAKVEEDILYDKEDKKSKK
jgi:hypothetical protein